MSNGRLDLGPLTVMEAVRTALDSLTLTAQDSGKNWTKALKTKLCDCGRELGCRVSAGGVGFGGEWLYDVTWTEYSRGYEPGTQNQLLDVHLVAECEWGNFAEIKKRLRETSFGSGDPPSHGIRRQPRPRLRCDC